MKLSAITAASLLLIFQSNSGVAQVVNSTDNNLLAQQLGNCFAAKTNGEDRITVARWMIGALASSPQVSSTVKVDVLAKEDADKAMAFVFTRLFTKDCTEFATPILNSANPSEAFQFAGGKLGELAVQELMNNKQAAKSLENFSKYVDIAAINGLIKK
jgi:hypothetical protein